MKTPDASQLPRIDNERATDAERIRFLSLHGVAVQPPQHGGHIHYLRKGEAMKVLQAGDYGAALKEACALL